MLDLGAGSGLGAIAAAKAGAESVLAADTDPFALAAMALNAEANGVAFETTGADLLAAAPGAFGLVLVGDLFYERPLAERALAFVEAARDRGRTCWSATRSAAISPRSGSARIAEYSVPVTRDLEDMEIKHTAVWRLA